MPEIDPRLPQRLRVASADPELVGAGEAGFTIAGTLAAELLARGTTLDLDSVTDGARARTTFAGLPVWIRRRAGGFDLFCVPADGPAIEDWFAAALTAFAAPARP